MVGRHTLKKIPYGGTLRESFVYRQQPNKNHFSLIKFDMIPLSL